jgi:hypothetical protein
MQIITPMHSESSRLSAVFLELPVPVVQRTNLTGLQPSRYTVEVEGMLSNTALSTSVALVPGRKQICIYLHYIFPTRLCILPLWMTPGLLGIQCLGFKNQRGYKFVGVERSIHKSMIWLRQIAQLSTTISHAHRATAFH